MRHRAAVSTIDPLYRVSLGEADFRRRRGGRAAQSVLSPRHCPRTLRRGEHSDLHARKEPWASVSAL